MCKNAYEQISKHTKKIMIFCNRMGKEDSLNQLCVSQRFCPDKNRYIDLNQKQDCKYFE